MAVTLLWLPLNISTSVEQLVKKTTSQVLLVSLSQIYLPKDIHLTSSGKVPAGSMELDVVSEQLA